MQIVVIVSVLVILILIAFCMMKGRTRKKTQLLPHLEEKLDEKIFVILPRFADDSIVDRIFTTARFPKRVFVGVGTMCAPQFNVRSLPFADQVFGDSVARSRVLLDLYKKEDYILIADENALFMQMDWDHLLIEQARNRPEQIISSWPLLMSKGKNRPTYPIFAGFLAHLPVFEPRIAHKCEVFNLTMCNPRIVFGHSDIMQDLIHQTALPFTGHLEDVLMWSFVLFMKRIEPMSASFYIADLAREPIDRIFDQSHSQYQDLRKRTDEIITNQILLHGNEEFFKKRIGIDTQLRTVVDSRAFFGFLPGYSENEILIFYPSMSDFVRVFYRESEAARRRNEATIGETSPT